VSGIKRRTPPSFQPSCNKTQNPPFPKSPQGLDGPQFKFCSPNRVPRVVSHNFRRGPLIQLWIKSIAFSHFPLGRFIQGGCPQGNKMNYVYSLPRARCALLSCAATCPCPTFQCSPAAFGRNSCTVVSPSRQPDVTPLWPFSNQRSLMLPPIHSFAKNRLRSGDHPEPLFFLDSLFLKGFAMSLAFCPPISFTMDHEGVVFSILKDCRSSTSRKARSCGSFPPFYQARDDVPPCGVFSNNGPWPSGNP